MLQSIFNWDTLWWLMLIPYILCCVGLILVVLLQKGKGVGFAGAFGVGPGSETLFGPRSAKSLPQKLTYFAAALFMVLALVMSTIAGKLGKGAAPALVDETAIMESASLDALFDEEPVDAPAAVPAEPPAATAPIIVETVEVPAEEAPAADEAAPEAVVEIPAPAEEAPAADEAAPEAAEEAPESAEEAASPAVEADAPADNTATGDAETPPTP